MDFLLLLWPTVLMASIAADLEASLQAQDPNIHVNDTRQLVSASITIGLESSNFSIDTRFLSLALSPKHVPNFCRFIRLNSTKTLASALAPADLRIGGSFVHYMTFDPHDDSCTGWRRQKSTDEGSVVFKGRRIRQQIFSGGELRVLTQYMEEVGWNLLLYVNDFKFKDDGSWDPTNMNQMLEYSSKNGINIPYFYLGNEPDAYSGVFKRTIEPEQMAQNFRVLKNTMLQYDNFTESKLYGPDVGHGDRKSRYLRRFLAAGACDSIDGISRHHYYFNARKFKSSYFMDVKVMDSLKSLFRDHYKIVQETCSRPLPLLLTETSSSSGGGAGGFSDRYISGFLWLDKLGLSAQFGVSRVHRQSLFGGAYGIVSYSLDNPHPDYFLSVIFKQLVEGPVLSVKVQPSDPKLRVYANCARNLRYKPGSVVLYYLNLDEKDRVLSFLQNESQVFHLFKLTPGTKQDLTSRNVRLNGNVLSIKNSELPSMLPEIQQGNVSIESQSFGFIVLPEVSLNMCIEYFNSK